VRLSLRFSGDGCLHAVVPSSGVIFTWRDSSLLSIDQDSGAFLHLDIFLFAQVALYVWSNPFPARFVYVMLFYFAPFFIRPVITLFFPPSL